MKRGAIVVLVAFVIVCAMALTAIATDNVGNWKGYGNGTTTNSGAYIQYFRNVTNGLYGSCPTMVTFRLWSDNLAFSASGAGNDSSGELQISDWLGSGATFVWSVANDSAANDDSLTVTVEMKNCVSCSWYTVLTLANGDSAQVVEGTTFIDSLDFGNPALRHPYMRIYLDGKGIAAGKTKYTKFTGDVTLFKPTQ